MSKISVFFATILITQISLTCSLQGGWIENLIYGRKTQDVSDSPEARKIIGKQLELKVDCFIDKSSCSENKLTLHQSGSGPGDRPKTIGEYQKRIAKGQSYPLVYGIARVGTKLRICRVEEFRKRGLGATLLIPYATIESGEHSQVEVEIGCLLIGNSDRSEDFLFFSSFAKFVDGEP